MPLDTGVRPGSRTGTDAPAPGRRRLVVVAAAAAAVALLVGLYLYVNRPAGDPARPLSLPARLAQDLAAQLEKSTPAEHLSHGHELGSEPGRLLCTVELYGVDPATATTVDQVRMAYGYHLCALGSRDFDWESAPKLVGPIVVDYASRPPSVRVVESGEGYPERIRQLIPERFQRQAVHGFTDGQTVADLRTRYHTVIPKA
jgi:hypothetical protein